MVEFIPMIIHCIALQVVACCCTNTFSKYLDPGATQEGCADVVGTKLRAIFPMTSMLSHSCLPNAEQTISDLTDSMKLSMVAVIDIRQGEQIFISYTELLAPTLVRRSCLLNNKLFLCQCPR